MNVLRRRLMAGRHHIEPLQRIGLFAGARFVEIVGSIGELRRELRDEFGADFVAARTDARTDGGKNVCRIGLEARVEFAGSFLKDARKRTAPPCVNGGHDTFFGIDEEDRNAVGSLNAEKKARSLRQRSVAFTRFLWRGGERPNDGGVDLFESDEREFLRAEGGLEFFAVGENVLTGVPVGEAEIQTLPAIELGDAAGS